MTTVLAYKFGKLIGTRTKNVIKFVTEKNPIKRKEYKQFTAKKGKFLLNMKRCSTPLIMREIQMKTMIKQYSHYGTIWWFL